MTDIAGQKFGLVTVTHRDPWSSARRSAWFAVCECGRGRWFKAENLRGAPPKTHRFCRRGKVVADAPELPLETAKAGYEDA